MSITGIYKSYVTTMALMGRTLKWSKPRRHASGSSGSEKMPDDADLDMHATRTGNQYRALGTLVGLLGIAIVFLAIAPVGMQLDHETEHLLGWTKVGLMALMLAIVLLGGSSKLKKSWMDLRSRAEGVRYRHLFTASKELARTSNWVVHDQLRDGLIAVLAGEGGQIAYDEGKARQYEAIESFADVLLWASVILAFCGALLHLFFPHNWLIFLTAFGPAMVGGIHGINAFLCVGELAKKHESSAYELTICQQKLLAIQTAASHNVPILLALADEVLRVLTVRDTKWEAMVAEIGIKPA